MCAPVLWLKSRGCFVDVVGGCVFDFSSKWIDTEKYLKGYIGIETALQRII